MNNKQPIIGKTKEKEKTAKKQKLSEALRKNLLRRKADNKTIDKEIKS